MHIARLAALAPGVHPVAVGLPAFPAQVDLFRMPHDQIHQPGLELEDLDLWL